MFVDARTLASNALVEADVCVVGGGAAGLATAHGLAGSGARVVVLESTGHAPEGGAPPLALGRARGPLLARHNKYLAATRRRPFAAPQGAGELPCQPFDEEDFAPRRWVEGSGWPLTADDLAAPYARARQLLGTAPADGPATDFEALDDDVDFAVIGASPTLPAGGARRLAAALAAGGEVKIFTHSHVVALDLDAAGGRVESAVVRCVGGPHFTARGRHFVLAAGPLGNPRLLLASNRQRQTGLGNEHDLVGCYFADQPVLRAGFVTLPGRRGLSASSDGAEAGDERRVAWQPTAELQRRHELLNSRILLSPAAAAEGGRLSAAVTSSSAALARLDGREGFFGAVLLRGEQRPGRDSRVSLREERDALGLPLLDLSWRLDPHDSWSLLTTARLLGESLGRRGLGRLQLRAPERLHRRYFGWSGNQSGTTRMSDDPGTGVVDADCRVHELPNLFAAGSSVFPTSGAVEPLLTAVALALRLGEHLRSLPDT